MGKSETGYGPGILLRKPGGKECMSEKRYHTDAGDMVMGKDGIIRFRVSAGAAVDTATAEQCVRGARELAGDRAHLMLVDMRGLSSITQGARRVYNSGPSTACALLVGSPASRVIGSFFLGLNKPSYPLKLFTSETAAAEWLSGFAK